MELLTFTDIAMLATIHWTQRRNIRPAAIHNLIYHESYFNQWLTHFGVDSWLQMPLRRQQSVVDSVNKLADLGFILKRQGFLEVTGKGSRFLKEMGSWKKWPAEVPVDDGQPIMSEALYF